MDRVRNCEWYRCYFKDIETQLDAMTVVEADKTNYTTTLTVNLDT